MSTTFFYYLLLVETSIENSKNKYRHVCKKTNVESDVTGTCNFVCVLHINVHSYVDSDYLRIKYCLLISSSGFKLFTNKKTVHSIMPYSTNITKYYDRQ